MRVLITGSDGFIGKNLVSRLKQNRSIALDCFVKGDSLSKLQESVQASNLIVHLAAANRPDHEDEFKKTNIDLTKSIAELLTIEDCKCKRLIFSSTTKVEENSSYGISKLKAENVLSKLAKRNEIQISNLRFPGVFGKWSKPNYNSVVATFSHNIINDLPINVHNPNEMINLLYIDDALDFIEQELFQKHKKGFHNIKNQKYS